MFGLEADGLAAEVAINWLAVLVATVLAMIIGSIWYGPLFGERWMKLVELKKKDAEKNWKIPMATMTVMAFVQAIVVQHVLVYYGYFSGEITVLTGVVTGLWLFIGVALPLVLSNNMFARRPLELTYIESGNQLVTLVTIGAVMAAMY